MAEGVRDFLVDVHARGLAEIRWHTTWQAEAVEVFAPKFGLPVFPLAVAPEFEDRMGVREPLPELWWKMGAARRVLEDEGRRLVWTDDDLSDARLVALQRSVSRGFGPGEMLALCPHRLVGLTPEHLVMLWDFLES